MATKITRSKKEGNKSLHFSARISEWSDQQRGKDAIEAYEWIEQKRAFVWNDGQQDDSALLRECLLLMREKLDRGWQPAPATGGEMMQFFNAFGEWLIELHDKIEQLIVSGAMNQEGIEQARQLQKRVKRQAVQQQGMYTSKNLIAGVVLADEEEE